MTDAERRLWAALRGQQLAGLRFRRQVPIGPSIADFACHSARLVIEVDGGQHAEAAQAARDARRDAFITSQGYRVMRVWNTDVFDNLPGVLETIVAWARAPHPDPPPQGGRED
jgi:very-short-patch-repair endonuclease